MTVTPTATDANAAITVNGNPVTSGSPSGDISLSVGANTITTVVVSQDLSATTTYTVTRMGTGIYEPFDYAAGTLNPSPAPPR